MQSPELEFLKTLRGLGTEEEEGYPSGPPELEFLNNMGARHRVGIGFSYRPARAHTFKCLWGPGIDSKE
jgi:hypothetical protein